MHKLFLALLFLSSSAMAASPFIGDWKGIGNRTDAGGVHNNCKFQIEFTNLESDLEFKFITHNCTNDDDLNGMDFFNYQLNGSNFIDMFGNSVGTLVGNSINIKTGSIGAYFNIISIQLVNGNLIYSQEVSEPGRPKSNFKASGNLVQN